jgi:hypothetical protein
MFRVGLYTAGQLRKAGAAGKEMVIPVLRCSSAMEQLANLVVLALGCPPLRC